MCYNNSMKKNFDNITCQIMFDDFGNMNFAFKDLTEEEKITKTNDPFFFCSLEEAAKYQKANPHKKINFKNIDKEVIEYFKSIGGLVKE